MRKTALLLVVAAGACAEPVTLGQTAWQAELTGGPGGVTGSVAAVSSGQRTQVSIAIQRAQPGQQYAWRLNQGDCATEGTLLGGAAVYPILAPGESGSAQADAVLSRALSSGSYAARVLLVQAGGGQAVAACGPLLRTH